MLEVAPIWKELPAWVYFVGFIVTVSALAPDLTAPPAPSLSD